MTKLTTGERIEELRRNKRLTLKELSEEIKAKTGERIAVSTLSDLESSGKDPRLSTLRAIANYFSVSLDYLAGISEVKSPNTTLQAVHKMLGLSEAGIKSLQEANMHSMYFVLLALDELLKDECLYTLDKLGQYIEIDDKCVAERIDGQPIKQKTLFMVEVHERISDMRLKVQEIKGGSSNGQH